jgi:hypothetical protein
MFTSNRSLALAAANLRLKRHDSINPIIDKDRQLFQCLRSRSALREPACGFYAASFAVWGRFLGKDGAGAESRPRCRHPVATNVDRRLMRQS